MINPAGGGASPVDLEALEKRLRLNAQHQKELCVCWLTNPDRCGHCEHVADCADAADLLSELRAWRSQQGLRCRGSQHVAFTDRSTCECGAIDNPPLPQEARNEDDRTTNKS